MDLEFEANHLRELLKSKPQNARNLAKLAYILAEQSKNTIDNSNLQQSLYEHAVQYARQSIQTAPRKHFGYLAVSVIANDHSERMTAIQDALTCQSVDNCTRVILLTRLLVEPRDEEAKKVAGKIGKASPRHPCRRRLDKTEEVLYQELDSVIQMALSKAACGSEQEKIALRDNRLGRFFRKMEPHSAYRPRAVSHFRRSIEYLSNEADKTLAQFWLATLEGGVVAKCPPSYVVDLYSSFAEKFDQLLVDKLQYQTPTRLRELVDSIVISRSFDKAVDLGCGTGLSGVAFQSCVRHLDGVDLSSEMVEKAKARGCYESLTIGDVMTVLKEKEIYDFVFSCDVFVYLGDLSEVFRSVHSSLTVNGIFAFSTELLDEEHSKPFQLQSSARFAHKETYIVGIAETSGYKILGKKICPIRKNEGKDIIGLLVVLQKLTI